VVVVPYKSTGDILTALRARDVAAAFEILPPILAQIKSKTIRPLASLRPSDSPDCQMCRRSPRVRVGLRSGVLERHQRSCQHTAIHRRSPIRSIQAAVAAPTCSDNSKRPACARSSTPEQMTERLKSDMARWRVAVEKPASRASKPLQSTFEKARGDMRQTNLILAIGLAANVQFANAQSTVHHIRAAIDLP